MSADSYRHLPAVHEILDHPLLQELATALPRSLIVECARIVLAELRQRIQRGLSIDESYSVDAIASRVVQLAHERAASQFQTVINATGIVLHTNLGRSPMAESVALAVANAARGYLNLEIDLSTGKRASRQTVIRDLVRSLVGTESATVVNNCAAATVIVLRALAFGKEVIVSRGQLIEIGGSFRIPEIMTASGAILREVGTTNITRIGDYENAIGPNTALLMRIHTSNYRIRGFTQEVSLAELVALGKQYHLPVIDDAGSGAMIDFAPFGLPGEPVIPESVAAGVDLVLFSGDKLLGGPQSGIIAGKSLPIERIERDPLMRAFRLDKMTLAALEATLCLYRDPEKALQQIPTLRLLSLPLEKLHERATHFSERVRMLPGIESCETKDDTAFVGGGSLPDLPLPTVVVAMDSNKTSETEFAERLRQGKPAVIARIQNGKVLIDLRTVFETDEDRLIQAIAAALK